MNERFHVRLIPAPDRSKYRFPPFWQADTPLLPCGGCGHSRIQHLDDQPCVAWVDPGGERCCACMEWKS